MVCAEILRKYDAMKTGNMMMRTRYVEHAKILVQVYSSFINTQILEEIHSTLLKTQRDKNFLKTFLDPSNILNTENVYRTSVVSDLQGIGVPAFFNTFQKELKARNIAVNINAQPVPTDPVPRSGLFKAYLPTQPLPRSQLKLKSVEELQGIPSSGAGSNPFNVPKTAPAVISEPIPRGTSPDEKFNAETSNKNLPSYTLYKNLPSSNQLKWAQIVSEQGNTSRTAALVSRPKVPSSIQPGYQPGAKIVSVKGTALVTRPVRAILPAPAPAQSGAGQVCPNVHPFGPTSIAEVRRRSSSPLPTPSFTLDMSPSGPRDSNLSVLFQSLNKTFNMGICVMCGSQQQSRKVVFIIYFLALHNLYIFYGFDTLK